MLLSAIKRKKDQQLTNKQNFIEGHQIMLSRVMNEKRHERQMDVKAVHVAMEELRREKERKLNEIVRNKTTSYFFNDTA